MKLPLSIPEFCVHASRAGSDKELSSNHTDGNRLKLKTQKF